MERSIPRSGVDRAPKAVPLLCFLSFYTVLANVPCWALNHELGVARVGWFCVQYATVGLIALFVRRIYASLLLFFMILIDLLCAVSISYNLPIRQCLTDVFFVGSFNRSSLGWAAFVIFLSILTAATAQFIPAKCLPQKHREIAAFCLIGFALSIIVSDVALSGFRTGEYRSPFRPWTDPDRVALASYKIPHLTRFPLIMVMQLAGDASLRHLWDKQPPPPTPVPSATTVALHAAEIESGRDARDLPNVVLILVESWGMSNDPVLEQGLLAPYRDSSLDARYDTVQGTVPFYGPTVAGEARELCSSTIGFGLLKASKTDLKNCLPAQLAGLGYDTMSAHGNTRNFFNRGAWYSTIGFQEKWFHSNFRKHGLPDCQGMFVGICDASIADSIGKRLALPSSRPRFIYWLTLNSHLPAPIPAPISDRVPCPADASIEPNSPLCAWYQLVANVHRSVARVAKSNLARPTVFVIVGDHAPPFADPLTRSRFSQKEVPYIVLVPRENGQPGHFAPEDATRLAKRTESAKAHRAVAGD